MSRADLARPMAAAPSLGASVESVEAAGAADAGFGLRATAERLGMGFVPCGEERVRILVAEGRREKPGVRRLERAVEDADDVLGSLSGYGR